MSWPRGSIHFKLLLGFALVAGMVLILLAGAGHGLRAFHGTNLTLVDQLRELGAARVLLERVIRLEPSRWNVPGERERLVADLRLARESLRLYHRQLNENRLRGNRADDGIDELRLAYAIDEDLTALLREASSDPDLGTVLEDTPRYFEFARRANAEADAEPAEPTSTERLARLNRAVLELPGILYQDFYRILQQSKTEYLSSRVIVASSAFLVVVLLIALSALLYRWVLYPVRLLHRGVKRVAKGGFDHKIQLRTGDEMQSLAEAFNEMTARIHVTYQDLERQVQERSRQLVRSERLAGVGFLAAGVAHEINNPLASIAFCTEAMEMRLGPILERWVANDASGQAAGEAKVVRDYLRIVQEEAFRCKRITEKLLDFSRCSEIQREPTELGGLIEDVAEMARHMGKYRGKTIKFEHRQAVVARIDPQEIKQVLLNLVVNALDSTDQGGTLEISLREADGMAEMVFRDNGHGIGPEALENIFEPFYTTRKNGKGTGLGLSITHRIVSQHHGEIFAESEGVGRGATFTVRLPTEATEREREREREQRRDGGRVSSGDRRGESDEDRSRTTGHGAESSEAVDRRRAVEAREVHAA